MGSLDVSPATPILATGTVIGSPGSWRGLGNTIDKVFDGNLDTFYDAAHNSGDWVGLDLGTAVHPIVEIRYAPRATWADRMVGGQFQVSSSVDFKRDVHTLHTVTSAPVEGRLATVSVPNVGAFRYARYIGPTNGQGNVAVIQFLVSTAAAPIRLIGTPVDTTSPNGNYVGIDLGSAKAVTQVRFAPRAGRASRMVGGKIQASSWAQFDAGIVTAHVVTAAPTEGVLTVVTLGNVGAYRYWRYLETDGASGNIADIEFFA